MTIPSSSSSSRPMGSLQGKTSLQSHHHCSVTRALCLPEIAADTGLAAEVYSLLQLAFLWPGWAGTLLQSVFHFARTQAQVKEWSTNYKKFSVLGCRHLLFPLNTRWTAWWRDREESDCWLIWLCLSRLIIVHILLSTAHKPSPDNKYGQAACLHLRIPHAFN